MIREGFVFPASGTMTIVVFRPDVSVGAQKAGGVIEPNAEWTEAARTNIKAKMVERAAAFDARVEFVDELEGQHAALLTEYRYLFQKVSDAISNHMVGSETLPTKRKFLPDPGGRGGRGRTLQMLDWSLGPGTARLREATGTDYAMFVYSNDAYGDNGRKASQAAGLLGCVIGVCEIVDSGVHVGYAGLVELATGNVVWFNTDPEMGGDPRKIEGADKRVGQLMQGFPLRESQKVDKR